MNNVDGFANQDFANKLKKDLEGGDPTLKEIDMQSVNQLFTLFNINVPENCDANGDGKLFGSDELKCLNMIWKAYLPPDAWSINEIKIKLW